MVVAGAWAKIAMGERLRAAARAKRVKFICDSLSSFLFFATAYGWNRHWLYGSVARILRCIFSAGDATFAGGGVGGECLGIGRDNSKNNDKNEIQGSLHYGGFAAFGRDDVVWKGVD